MIMINNRYQFPSALKRGEELYDLQLNSDVYLHREGQSS